MLKDCTNRRYLFDVMANGIDPHRRELDVWVSVYELIINGEIVYDYEYRQQYV